MIAYTHQPTVNQSNVSGVQSKYMACSWMTEITRPPVNTAATNPAIRIVRRNGRPSGRTIGWCRTYGTRNTICVTMNMPTGGANVNHQSPVNVAVMT